MEFEPTNKFDRNDEARSSLMKNVYGRQSFNTPTLVECSSSGHSHKTKFIKYLRFEELSKYKLDDSQHIDDEASFEYQILKHLK